MRHYNTLLQCHLDHNLLHQCHLQEASRGGHQARSRSIGGTSRPLPASSS
jgi:hypothetical protein